MKTRSQVFNVFQKFYQEIKTQFGILLKTLRSGNALEYLSNDFTSFCSSLCIIHQTSCVHMLQQNGIVEKKNKHLLDVTCTLSSQMNVPSSYWRYAILTTCFPINRLPSSVLRVKSPISIFYPKDLPFPLNS